MNKLDNLFKTLKTILSLFAFALIIYGVFTLIMPNKFKKKETKKAKSETKIDINFADKLDYLDKNVYYDFLSFDSNFILRLATLNIDDNYLKVSDFTHEIEGYYFNHKKVEASVIDGAIKKIFGDIEYEKVDFSISPDNYYYYNVEDDSYYMFERLVEYTICTNDFETDKDKLIVTNNVSCGDNSNRYNIYFEYSKDKKDYFIKDIKLIEE